MPHLNPQDYPILVDISKWNKPVDYDLLKANGVQGVIVKSGGSQGVDRMFDIHAPGVKAAGMVLGLYYWVDPLCDGPTQARHFASQADKYDADFLAADMEQWWSDWDKWYEMMLHHLDSREVPKLSTRQIEVVTHAFLMEVKSIFPTKPLLVYTNPDFVDTWGTDTKSWINDYPLWLAQWPYTGGTLEKATITWETLRAQYLPDEGKTPYVPAYMSPPKVWQWSGERFILPGHAGRIDIDWFMGTCAEFLAWCNKDGGVIPVPPPPPPPPGYTIRYLKSGVYFLNARKNANANASSAILRIIPAGEPIYVTNDPPKNDTWLKLYGEDGYVNAKFLA